MMYEAFTDRGLLIMNNSDLRLLRLSPRIYSSKASSGVDVDRANTDRQMRNAVNFPPYPPA